LTYLLLAPTSSFPPRTQRDLDHISTYCPFLESDSTYAYPDGPENAGKLKEAFQSGHKSLGKAVFNTHLWPPPPPHNDNDDASGGAESWFPPPTTDTKYIYVHRPPRDAAASFYHHLTHMPPSEGGIDADVTKFVKEWVEGKVAYGMWGDHLDKWLGFARGNDNVLVVSYVDMRQDLFGVLLQVRDHLGLDLSEEAVKEKVMPRLTLEYMKSNVDKYEPKSVSWVEKGDGFQFVRTGGGAKGLFDQVREVSALPLFALCSLLFALCSLLFALCSLLFALCSLLFAFANSSLRPSQEHEKIFADYLDTVPCLADLGYN